MGIFQTTIIEEIQIIEDQMVLKINIIIMKSEGNLEKMLIIEPKMIVMEILQLIMETIFMLVECEM